jgi:hypothetical protein
MPSAQLLAQSGCRNRNQPLLLEAGIALALRGAGYENEAAADMVFKPRSSGGLAAAIEYACRLVA